MNSMPFRICASIAISFSLVGLYFLVGLTVQYIGPFMALLLLAAAICLLVYVISMILET